ncbi:hypothetical protein [Salinibacter ruber]|uniref:hypothetical protein n=1 Tax=Salinibacter ruber TaxID=146919 RepID=UPI001F076543|nr:hypothetical protein [Salinibacter ruber]
MAGDVFAQPDTTVRRRFRRVTGRVLGALAGRARVIDTARAVEEGGEADADAPAARPSPIRADSSRADALATPEDSLGTQRDATPPDSLLDGGPVAVNLTAVESSIPVAPRRLTTPPDSLFEFVELPEGRYRFRAYLDRNENGRWDGGQIQPYVPAEPVTWLREPLEARPRWTTELPVPLRIPVLVPEPARPDASPPDTSGSAGRGR